MTAVCAPSSCSAALSPEPGRLLLLLSWLLHPHPLTSAWLSLPGHPGGRWPAHMGPSSPSAQAGGAASSPGWGVTAGLCSPWGRHPCFAEGTVGAPALSARTGLYDAQTPLQQLLPQVTTPPASPRLNPEAAWIEAGPQPRMLGPASCPSADKLRPLLRVGSCLSGGDTSQGVSRTRENTERELSRALGLEEQAGKCWLLSLHRFGHKLPICSIFNQSKSFLFSHKLTLRCCSNMGRVRGVCLRAWASGLTAVMGGQWLRRAGAGGRDANGNVLPLGAAAFRGDAWMVPAAPAPCAPRHLASIFWPDDGA